MTGQRRLSADQVSNLAGLRVGESIAWNELDGVVKKLLDTGLLTAVRYEYRPVNNRLELRFEVQEAAWTMPVVFDNFVWFTDDELRAV